MRILPLIAQGQHYASHFCQIKAQNLNDNTCVEWVVIDGIFGSME